ncbi:cytochrome c oxidase subunit 3 [Hephaestia sp. GCM10023244]|uniref:cytochrome c oxidase subunit 3 n=1 Tax=unclassified Hephaestia TaxID=2631281 RepID=UPI0020774E3B|nr:cytochrome c oxidase subunit 3 [Hephaestia sp. MAHUQ-44]MCM8732364.1 cytochrome c oxidase subunit 3 [Hephaestia sp. MAHUQ-44]
MTLARHEPFPDIARQREADRFGMVVFLASEAMLFGAVVMGLFALRTFEPAAFAATSQRLNLVAGSVNTAVLLTSSLLVAIGDDARAGDRLRLAKWLLTAAALLGLVFLAIKGSEYLQEYGEGLMPGVGPKQDFATPAARMFMDGYFVATGLHALHVTIGVALLAGCAWRLRGDDPPSVVGIGNVGLYWHLVDIVWVFLFPILYLSR